MNTQASDYLPRSDSRPMLEALSAGGSRESVESIFNTLNALYHDGQMEDTRSLICSLFTLADMSCPAVFFTDFNPATLDELIFSFLCDFDDYLEETATYG